MKMRQLICSWSGLCLACCGTALVMTGFLIAAGDVAYGQTGLGGGCTDVSCVGKTSMCGSYACDGGCLCGKAGAACACS